jgi:hypothetical protein
LSERRQQDAQKASPSPQPINFSVTDTDDVAVVHVRTSAPLPPPKFRIPRGVWTGNCHPAQSENSDDDCVEYDDYDDDLVSRPLEKLPVVVSVPEVSNRAKGTPMHDKEDEEYFYEEVYIELPSIAATKAEHLHHRHSPIPHPPSHISTDDLDIISAKSEHNSASGFSVDS